MMWAKKEEVKKKTDTFEERMAKEILLEERALEMAKEREALILKGLESDREAMIAEHTKDLEHYKFQAWRWGDFLQIGIKRWGHRCKNFVNEEKLLTLATAINLADTCSFTLNNGEAPGHMAPVHYHAHRQHNPETNEWDQITISPAMPSKPDRSMMSHRHTGSGGSSGIYLSTSNEIRCWHTTEYPHFAEDDKIVFERMGVYFHVPYGLGEEVQLKLLRAIKEF